MNNNEVIPQFAAFTTAEWIAWMDAFMNGKKMEPPLYLDDHELDTKLIWIRNKFNAADIDLSAFSKAIVAQIMTLAEKKKKIPYLYQLIRFVGLLKPESHATELELLFKKEQLANIDYEGIELQSVLLAALINFASINDFTGYFQSRLTYGNNASTDLLGLKYYYTKKTTKEYFRFVERLIDKINTSYDIEKMTKNIVRSFQEMTFYKSNYNELYDWLTDYANKLEYTAPQIYAVMMNEFARWLNNNNETIKKDNYALMLGNYLEAAITPTVGQFKTFINELEGRKQYLSAYDLTQASKVFAIYHSNPEFNPYDALPYNDNVQNDEATRLSNEEQHNRIAAWSIVGSQYAGLGAKLTKAQHDQFRDFMCSSQSK